MAATVAAAAALNSAKSYNCCMHKAMHYPDNKFMHPPDTVDRHLATAAARILTHACIKHCAMALLRVPH
jgi:hypothetical protein